MAQYEADKVIALLQFTCWKSHVEMNHSGLLKLRDKLVDFTENGDGFDPKDERIKSLNEKYLVDLLSDSNVASKKDNQIHKSKSYMNLLLEFSGFDSWETWETYFCNATEYLSSEKIDMSVFSTLELGICFPSQLEKKLLPNLSFVKKNTAYPVHLLSLSKELLSELLNYSIDLLKEYPFVICAIPVQWSSQSDVFGNTIWNDLLQSKRILPVWIDETNAWEIQLSSVPWLKNQQTIGGLRGLLCGLLYIHDTIKQIHHDGPNNQKEAPKIPSVPQIQTFHNNKGVVLLGNFRTENTAMGDITIHNYRNTKKDDTND